MQLVEAQLQYVQYRFQLLLVILLTRKISDLDEGTPICGGDTKENWLVVAAQTRRKLGCVNPHTTSILIFKLNGRFEVFEAVFAHLVRHYIEDV